MICNGKIANGHRCSRASGILRYCWQHRGQEVIESKSAPIENPTTIEVLGDEESFAKALIKVGRSTMKHARISIRSCSYEGSWRITHIECPLEQRCHLGKASSIIRCLKAWQSMDPNARITQIALS